nr:hypothetical protein [Escherichia coli]
MSALNSLPLPVVRLLAFFHEELSERRPGRVPQTVQLWVGCLLVILMALLQIVGGDKLIIPFC